MVFCAAQIYGCMRHVSIFEEIIEGNKIVSEMGLFRHTYRGVLAVKKKADIY